MMALKDQILAALANAGEAGLREKQLAANLCGSPEAGQLQVSSACENLMANGEIERHGEGTNNVPCTYPLPQGPVPRH